MFHEGQFQTVVIATDVDQWHWRVVELHVDDAEIRGGRQRVKGGSPGVDFSRMKLRKTDVAVLAAVA